MHISLLLMDCSFCLRNAEDMRSGMPDMSSSNTYDCARYEDLDQQPVLKRVNLSECECEICLIGLALDYTQIWEIARSVEAFSFFG